MSRTRIIRGKYTKISGGNYNISAEGNINSSATLEVRENGDEKGVFYGNYERLGNESSNDFEIDFSQKKDGIYSTVVPFGILDFEGNFENPFFAFNYSLYLGNIDSLSFEVLSEEGNLIYSVTNLPEIVVTARKHPKMLENIKKNKPEFNSKKPVNIWDWKPSYNPFVISVSDYTKIGSYVILWDGFNNNDIYDSANFNDKTLKVKITARKGGNVKSRELEVKTSGSKVEWIDIKIDKKNKKVDTELRVNLKDGGTEGLSSWDEVSKEALSFYNKPPIKIQERKYADLEKLALQGIDQFWSRNSRNVGKGVSIASDQYEVFTHSKADNNGLSAPSIIYQTNIEAGRSRNFEASRKLFFYEGYLYRDSWKKSNPSSIFYKNKGWIYRSENINEEKNVLLNLPPLVEDFKMVSAHEIGHEILLAYGGQIYSKGHKGTTTWINLITQDVNDDAPYIPTEGEIDLMKYYQDYYDISRTVITEFDLLKLIWLSKIKIL